MTWPMEEIDFLVKKIRVKTMDLVEVPALAQAIHDPGSWYDQFWGIKTLDDWEKTLKERWEKQQKNIFHPISYWLDKEPLGVTSLSRFDEANKTLEIGYTKVAPKWCRTFVNTEVKLGLLNYCFEKLGCVRVEFRVDSENILSQKALKRIGAVKEGLLRHRQILPNGTIRDGFLYSIVKPEWEKTKGRLEKLLK